MKANKPILLNVPSFIINSLNKQLEANAPRFNYDLNYFYFIIHYILKKQSQVKKMQQLDADANYVSLNKNLLKSITTSNINEYINYLKNGEFIITDNYYIIGKKSIGYKIKSEYLTEIRQVEIHANHRLFKKIINKERKKNAHVNRLEPFLKRMRDEFIKMELNYSDAEKWIINEADEVKRSYYHLSLNLLKDKRFRYFNRNKTNLRLDSNLTNLKKDLRKFIIGNYVNIDLKNSQPFFFSMLLQIIINNNKNTINNNTISLCSKKIYYNIVKTFGIKAIQKISKIHQIEKKPFLVNLKNFNNSVINGTLYEDFIKSYNGNIKRDEVKKMMFCVFFSENERYDKFKLSIPYEQDKKVFETVYPYVYKCMKILKSKNNAILPIFLQKLESYVFIDCIAKELVNNGIIPFTIHDSVIIKKEYEQKAIDIINKIFIDSFNVIPSLHIEQY